MKVRIDIDSNSGFCFGVVTAIDKAEEELATNAPLYCLGDIVHNSEEVLRLRAKGLRTITHADLGSLRGARVLLRAHGEPPSTYLTAKRNDITLVDATCPVVLKLQQRIKKAYDQARAEGRSLQIVIYGQSGHAEVNGLVGQTDGTAIVIENADQLDRIDFGTDISLYSQTTKSLDGFKDIIERIAARVATGVRFEYSDTICRQVANRVELLRGFARTHDVILFVAGEKSSNGKILFNECRDVNSRTFMISSPENLDPEWLKEAESVGICGATSTPRWLMERIAERAEYMVNNNG